MAEMSWEIPRRLVASGAAGLLPRNPRRPRCDRVLEVVCSPAAPSMAGTAHLPVLSWASGTTHPPVLSLGLYLHPSSQTTGSGRASTGTGLLSGHTELALEAQQLDGSRGADSLLLGSGPDPRPQGFSFHRERALQGRSRAPVTINPRACGATGSSALPFPESRRCCSGEGGALCRWRSSSNSGYI